MTEMNPKSAAVFRVEGVLLKRGSLSFATYLAANAQGIGERVFRLGQVALAVPISQAFRRTDRERSSELAYYPLKGMSRDRVIVLAEEYFENRLKQDLLREGIELVRQAQEEGREIVLVGDIVEELMRCLAKHLGVSHYLANRLEYQNRFATGNLLRPVIGSQASYDELRRVLASHSSDLAHARGFASFGSDASWLRLVKDPCVVNPDHLMRRMVRLEKWPTLRAHR